MFAHIHVFKDALAKYLTEYNENINWSDFISEYILNTIDNEMPENPDINTPATSRDIKILKLIKSRLWTDKQYINIEKQLKSHRIDHIKYYSKLLGAWFTYYSSLLSDKPIYIIGVNPNSKLPEEVNNEIMARIDVLQKSLAFKGWKGDVITLDEFKSEKRDKFVLFTTGTVTYPDVCEVSNIIDGNIITIFDDYYNLCEKEFDNEFNRICLTVRLMFMKQEELEDIVKLKYGMLKIVAKKFE